MTNIIKYIHGWQNIGYQKHCINLQTKESICILCGESEQQFHYHFCNHTQFSTHKKNAWKSLKQVLTRENTHPEIISILSIVISHNISYPDEIMNEEIQTTRDSNIIQAIGKQSEIGWIHLFLGRMSKK